MSTITVRSKPFGLQVVLVRILVGLLAMFVLAALLKTLIDSLQQAEKATRPVREVVNTVRTADKVLKLTDETAKNEAVTEESVWVTYEGDTLPNPYTKAETEQLIEISNPRIVNDGSQNGRRAYHLIDQSISKWNKIPFDEIIEAFRNGKLAKDLDNKLYIFNEKWVLPVIEHNGKLKATTIYRTTPNKVKQLILIK